MRPAIRVRQRSDAHLSTQRSYTVHTVPSSHPPPQPLHRREQKRHSLPHTAQNVSRGFLLDPSGGSLKIHRLRPVSNESPVLVTPATRTPRGVSGETILHYCPQMPCVNAELASLHSEATSTAEWLYIDRYLPLCSILKTVTDSNTRIPKDAPVRRMTITCLCGDPTHAVTLSKTRDAACFPFDHSFPYQPEITSMRAGNR